MQRVAETLRHHSRRCVRHVSQARSLSQGAKVAHVSLHPKQFVCSSFVRPMSSAAFNSVYPKHDIFAERHMGPNGLEEDSMLHYIGLKVGDLLDIL